MASQTTSNDFTSQGKTTFSASILNAFRILSLEWTQSEEFAITKFKDWIIEQIT
jgi:hypothetical protein